MVKHMDKSTVLLIILLTMFLSRTRAQDNSTNSNSTDQTTLSASVLTSTTTATMISTTATYTSTVISTDAQSSSLSMSSSDADITTSVTILSTTTGTTETADTDTETGDEEPEVTQAPKQTSAQGVTQAPTKQKVEINGTCEQDGPDTQCLTPNASCINSICQCDRSRFYKDEECKLQVEINGTCEQDGPDTQCLTPNASCINSICQCDRSRFYKDEDCKLQVEINGTCEQDGPDTQCLTPNASCINSICQCDRSRFYKDEDCKLQVEINGTCEQDGPDTQCLTPNASCINSICQCDRSRFYKDEECKLQVEINGTCEQDGPDTQCFTPNASCINSICQCDRSRFYKDEECKLQVEINGTCEQDGPDTQCFTPNASCINSICQCDRSRFYKDEECKLQVEINGTCEQDGPDTQCLTPNASCINSICQCDRSRFYKDEECKLQVEINGTCEQDGPDTQCLTPNASCINSICQCDRSRFYKDEECKLQVEINGTCEQDGPDTQCLTPNASCINSICQCDRSRFYKDEECKLQVEINGTCEQDGPDTQCLTPNASCINSICQCDRSRFYKDEECKLRPELPKQNFSIINIEVNRFQVSWTNLGLEEDTSVVLELYPPDNNNKWQFNNFQEKVFPVKYLRSGTLYKVSLYVERDGIPSADVQVQETYTVPEALTHGNISPVWEKNFTVNLIPDKDKMCEKYELVITPPPVSGDRKTIILRTERRFEMKNLTGGTEYTVNITAIAGNQRSSKNLSLTTFTRPAAPNVSVTYRDETTIDLTAKNTSFFNQLLVLVNSTKNDTINLTDTNVRISGLTMGTSYNMEFFSMIDGLSSVRSTKVVINTRSGPPQSPSISSIHEDSFRINWKKPENGAVDKYCLLLSDVGNTTEENWICVTASTMFYIYHNLTAGNLYSVCITTEWMSLGSIRNVTKDTYTRPTPPSSSSVKIKNIERQHVTISIEDDKTWEEYTFLYSSPMADRTNKTVPVTELPVHLDQLKNGTLYLISIFSEIGGVVSERSTNISTYTRPGDVQSITADRSLSNESTLYIKWDTTLVGHYDKFEINETCRSPNTNTTMEPYVQNLGNRTWAVLSHLDPGTFCNVAIASVIQNVEHGYLLRGEFVFQALNVSTNESAPEQVTISANETLADTITFSWAKPLNPNGYVRRYKTLVIDEYHNCVKAKIVYIGDTHSGEDGCQNETSSEPDVCTNSSNSTHASLEFNQETNGLHPYRNYTIIIQAYTKCWGKEQKRRLQTKIAEPSAYPEVITYTSTESSIELSWRPLNALEEGNGPITSYTVRKSFIESACSDAVHGHLTIENTTCVANGTKLDNLKSYWNYTITISASTEAGEGPQSKQIQYSTEQSTPGKIDPKTIKTETTGITNTTIKWSVPCLTNGIITNYSVDVINNATSERIISTSETTTVVTQDLDPYSNYSISVRAFTSIGPGEYTSGKPFRTRVGEPRQPTEVKVTADTPSTLKVIWKRLEKYTGPTNFTVVAFDSESNKKKCETGYNFYAINCTVKGLDAYWNYTVYVQATTDAGTSESKHKKGTTAESTPGNVTNVQLETEQEVTKPRHLTITWGPPIRRDLNGELTNYFVQCTRIGGENVVYSFKTDNNMHIGNVSDIKPGTYKVEVFAATRKGNGTRVIKKTTVQPGAPIKSIDESGNTLLMQPSTLSVSDDERQLAVQLPLKDLLCNIRNGPVIRWGVIVSQEDKATDISFSGSTKDFNKKVAMTYKNWFAVKDMDSIPPYIATPVNWTAHCQTFYNGNRRKRATETNKYQDFIVGEDGKCSGVKSNQYCNGELQPGRSYRVKSYVCTTVGCTETEYSKPISTVPLKIKAPDLTIPVAAGVASAVVVLAVVGGVVFLLRRKKLVCFAKDDESVGTHTPGEGIHLDKIEPTKKNVFSPGPIKLSDFPDIVEKMHRDSDLIFADAYKLLKEKSPNHPMTAAEQQCCRPKNRYTNILPFDHSRVKLRPSDDMEGSDYINANYIPGYTSRREYIATQGPMQATFDDFWRMVWEQNVDTIVMLTKLMEKGRRKCDKYWPDIGEPVFYGDLVVSIQSESNLSDYIIKIIEIKMKEEKKMVRHFSYLKWPDMGCPDTPELLLEFVKAVRQYTNREKRTSSGPTIVHCSAGVGRTGTFIAVDYLLQHIRDHDEVDIYSLVVDMRNHRLNMVQTEDQYVYIHECLKAFITTDEEEEDEEDEEPVYMNTAQEENVYENTAFQKD